MIINYFITHFPYKDHFDNPSRFVHYKCGGAERVAYYLALEMAKRGHEINVFTTSINSSNSVEKYSGINIYRYSTVFRIEGGSLSLGLFTKTFNYDGNIVHVHFSTPPAEIAALLYAKRKELPIVLTYHGDWQESFGGIARRMALYFYNKFLLHEILSRVDVIISPSRHYVHESRFLAKYQDKIVVIPNGINVKDFNAPYSKEECRKKLGLEVNGYVILFVGNLTPYKGPEILVRAMPEVMREIPSAELVFVGNGSMRKELEELSKRLGIEKHVKFAGFVKESLKPLYYKAADVFCLPSVTTTESFGIVNLEAMACGVPIVASKVGGIPDVVRDGENGLLVPPKNPLALAHAIVRLLEDERLRKRMGEKAKKEVEKYSWEKIAEMTEKLYEQVLSR